MNITFVSGKRGGFGAMLPTLRLLQKDHKVNLILCDQHSTDKFGPQTAGEENEFEYVRLGSEMEKRTSSLMDQGRQMVKAFKGLNTELLLVIGDRLESLVAASVATGENIPIAHVEGGDLSGGQDESIRHAISKLAHIHFCANEDCAERLCQMGEEKWRIHITGDVHIDQLMKWRGNPCVSPDPYLVVIFHPNSLDPDRSAEETRQVLDGVLASGLSAHVGYPCSDPGHEEVIEIINDYAEEHQRLLRFQNLTNEAFISLLEGAAAIVGNSSCGIKEAPYLGVPAVNVGLRQDGRLSTVMNCVPYSMDIEHGIGFALASDPPPPADYGDGNAYKRIARVINGLELGGALLRKKFNDYQGAAHT